MKSRRNRARSSLSALLLLLPLGCGGPSRTPGDDAGFDAGPASVPCHLPPDRSTPLSDPPAPIIELETDFDGGFFALISSCGGGWENQHCTGGVPEGMWHYEPDGGQWTDLFQVPVALGISQFTWTPTDFVALWNPAGCPLSSTCGNLLHLQRDGGIWFEDTPFESPGTASLCWTPETGLLVAVTDNPAADQFFGIFRRTNDPSDGGSVWEQLAPAPAFAVTALAGVIYYVGIDAGQPVIEQLDGGSWSIPWQAIGDNTALRAVRPGVFLILPSLWDSLFLIGDGPPQITTDCQSAITAFAPTGPNSVLYGTFTPPWQLDGGVGQHFRFRQLSIP